MDLTELNIKQASFEPCSKENLKINDQELETTNPDIIRDVAVTIEAEIPEVLYLSMREFIGSNPQWDQYSLMSSALANFLFQNGSEDRAVVERYLNDLFTLTDS